MDLQTHWETVYETKSPDEVSWFQEHPETSLALIERTGVAPCGPIIDVGGGASTLAGDLQAKGFENLTVLDISATALRAAQERLGPRSASITWTVADITAASLPDDHFEVWHDRAVFHFLTDAADRRKYVDRMVRSVRPGGHVIIATFGLDGPPRCSGIPVVRYSPETLHEEFGAAVQLIDSQVETHQTPSGTAQQFLYCDFRRA